MNGTIEGRASDRANNLLDEIPAGGTKTYDYAIEVLTDRQSVQSLRALNR